MSPTPTDFDRDLVALLGPVAPDISRKLDGRLDVFDRVCILASRTDRSLTVDELTVVRRLILAGATDAEAVLADVRAAAFEPEPA